jgi:AcrR family transcriptional regulator
MGTGGDASPGGGSAVGVVAEVQRARILNATVQVVAERGFAGASVGLVCERAKVSRRTFYERFDDLDECLVAVLDGALAHATPLVVEAFDHLMPTHPWQEGMRHALAQMLAFFDEEPGLTRVCLLELGTATPLVRAHRERILAAFAALVMQRIGSEVSHASPLAAEGTYASVVGIVNARLVGSGQPPLLELVGPLMGVIVGPFMDEAQVAREIERGEEIAAQIQAERAQRDARPQPPSGIGDEPAAVEIPALLRNPRAARARLCVRYLAEQGKQGLSPSNWQIAAAVGIAHQGQVSKLLAGLESCGLLVKESYGPGRPNAWRLTPHGRDVAAHFELRENDSRTVSTSHLDRVEFVSING